MSTGQGSDIEAWLAWLEYSKGRSPATVAKYGGYMRRLEKWAREGKGAGLLELTTEDLEAFTGLVAHQLGLTPRSRRALVAAVRGYYSWARRGGHISKDPSRLVEYPNAGRKLPRTASMQTAEALLLSPDLNTLVGLRDAAIFSVLIGCGLRLSGLCRLNESHLLWIQDEDGKERLVIHVTEKGNKERLVPAPTDTRLLVRAYLGHPDLDGIDRTLADGDRCLFVSTNNRLVPEHNYRGEHRRLSERSVQDMIRDRGRRLGLPEGELHAHALRHLYGTEMTEDDVNLAHLSALLGHQHLQTTRGYIRLATRKLSQIVDKSSPITKMQTPVRDLARKLDGSS